MGVTKVLRNFRLVLEGKADKKILASSRLEFLEQFSANNFALSDAADKTSRSLNRRGIADLPLFRMQSTICQKSRERSFWEMMDSFVLLAHRQV